MESKKGIPSTSVPPINDYEIPIAEIILLNTKKKLGSGAIGEIYYGINRKNKANVTIKLEPTKAKHPQIYSESKLYQALQSGLVFQNYTGLAPKEIIIF